MYLFQARIHSRLEWIHSRLKKQTFDWVDFVDIFLCPIFKDTCEARINSFQDRMNSFQTKFVWNEFIPR